MFSHLHCETVLRDLIFSINEPQVMPHGRYEAFSDVVSAGEGVRASKLQRDVARPGELRCLEEDNIEALTS